MPLRVEKLNKFLNLDLSQWCGEEAAWVEGNPWGGDWPSWVVNMLLTLRKIRSTSRPKTELIPELWQGQCIIYAELKPQEACCSPKGITRENLRQKLLIKKLKTHWDSTVICFLKNSENCDFGGDRTRNRAIFKKTLAKKAVQRKGQKVLRKSLQTSAE